MAKNTVVLGGGGVAGIAWELGVLRGIQDEAPDAAAVILNEATTLIGTSAGASVAAQLSSGTPLETLYAAQLAEQTAELAVQVDLAEFGATIMMAMSGAGSPEELAQRMGRIARAAHTPSSEARFAVIAARLPSLEWPSRELLLTAIDTASGELRVFDRSSGVSLLEAVAASCAVPGIWPSVEIDGRFYMDGGIRTVANADLAAASDRVLILVPGAEVSTLGAALTSHERAALASATSLSVFADDASLAAFGSNPFDPQTRSASAVAGRMIGQRVAATVAALWGS